MSFSFSDNRLPESKIALSDAAKDLHEALKQSPGYEALEDSCEEYGDTEDFRDASNELLWEVADITLSEELSTMRSNSGVEWGYGESEFVLTTRPFKQWRGPHSGPAKPYKLMYPIGFGVDHNDKPATSHRKPKRIRRSINLLEKMLIEASIMASGKNLKTFANDELISHNYFVDAKADGMKFVQTDSVDGDGCTPLYKNVHVLWEDLQRHLGKVKATGKSVRSKQGRPRYDRVQLERTIRSLFSDDPDIRHKKNKDIAKLALDKYRPSEEFPHVPEPESVSGYFADLLAELKGKK